jgi:TolA-binding protein
MKNDNAAIVFFCLLAVLICFLETWSSYEGKPEIQKTQHIQRIEVEDNQLEKQNKLLGKQIDELQSANDSLLQELEQVKKRVTQLKKTQHEKISRIDSLNGHELYDFFSKLKTSDSTLQQ